MRRVKGGGSNSNTDPSYHEFMSLKLLRRIAYLETGEP